jgi:predicted aspartyl protease
MRTWITALCIVATGCAAPLDPDAALTVVPYTMLEGGRVVVEVRVNDQGPFRFAVDTAATGSFLTERARVALALEPIPGETATVFGAIASGEFPLVEVASLELGSEIWPAARLIALPSATSATATLDGVLGADFLRRYSVGLTATDRALRLYHPATIGAHAHRGWSEIVLTPRIFGNSGEPLHFLEIEVEGRSVPALLDLGAGISVLNSAAARALRLEPTRIAERGEFADAVGSEPVIAQLGTQDLRTADIRWRNETFLIEDLDIFTLLAAEGAPLAILGSGLFTQRDCIIDFARERLLIRWSMSEAE